MEGETYLLLNYLPRKSLLSIVGKIVSKSIEDIKDNKFLPTKNNTTDSIITTITFFQCKTSFLFTREQGGSTHFLIKVPVLTIA